MRRIEPESSARKIAIKDKNMHNGDKQKAIDVDMSDDSKSLNNG